MSVRRRLDSLLSRLEEKYETYNRFEVSRGAILHNFDFFAAASKKHVIPVLKSNAYGHGIRYVALALKERRFPYLAVDGYFEALKVREVSRQPVLVMGMSKPENYEHMKFDRFAFVVHDAATVHALGWAGKQVKVHLEINSGMNRYGVRPEDVPRMVRLIQSYDGLKLEGIMTHLADNDGEEAGSVHDAVRIFDDAVDSAVQAGARPLLVHVANTAGVVRVDSRHANAVRIGIGIYGLNPFPPASKLHKLLRDLKPAGRLVSTIARINEVREGEAVGLGRRFNAPKDMRVGVLPIGYGDGLLPTLGNSGSVMIRKKEAPIIGQVGMDHILVALDGIEAKVGDEVIVISDAPKDRNNFASLVERYGTGPHEVLARLGADVRRYLVA